ncbi:PAAR domain-containing protein [Burkholderia ubonensis]|uniref:PAAR domain-containing protein n=1 Tax=Burkholderia ubonensis TaxID=101571 RepID=UPI0009B370D7|nr:PAAR domain-containing protein [Burkholderia ubonensis]
MALQIIVIGDTTSHGGRVITDSEGHAINGKSIARLRDLADCPVKYPDGRPHGVNKIIEAHPTLMDRSADSEQPLDSSGSRVFFVL